VVKLSADRLVVLRQALPLAEHFGTGLTEVDDWLTSLEKELESAPPIALGAQADQLKQQLEHNNVSIWFWNIAKFVGIWKLSSFLFVIFRTKELVQFVYF